MNSFSLYMSDLFSSPDAFDFSQGLVFSHIKATGCVCFSEERRRRRKDSRRAQPAGDARSTGQQGKRPGEWEGCSDLSSLPCWGRWERRGRTAAVRQDGGFVLNPGLPKCAQVHPSSYTPTPQPWACSGLLQLKASREKKAPPPPSGPQE